MHHLPGLPYLIGRRLVFLLRPDATRCHPDPPSETVSRRRSFIHVMSLWPCIAQQHNTKGTRGYIDHSHRRGGHLTHCEVLAHVTFHALSNLRFRWSLFRAFRLYPMLFIGNRIAAECQLLSSNISSRLEWREPAKHFQKRR